MDSHGFLGFLVEHLKGFFSDQVLWGSSWILAVAWQWWQAALAVLGLLEDLGKDLFAEFPLCSACGSAVDSACHSAFVFAFGSAVGSACDTYIDTYIHTYMHAYMHTYILIGFPAPLPSLFCFLPSFSPFLTQWKNKKH